MSSHLANLTKLESLILRNIEIEDINFLSRLNKITDLELSNVIIHQQQAELSFPSN